MPTDTNTHIHTHTLTHAFTHTHSLSLTHTEKMTDLLEILESQCGLDAYSVVFSFLRYSSHKLFETHFAAHSDRMEVMRVRVAMTHNI